MSEVKIVKTGGVRGRKETCEENKKKQLYFFLPNYMIDAMGGRKQVKNDAEAVFYEKYRQMMLKKTE